MMGCKRKKTNIVQARLIDNPTISLEENIYNRLNSRWFDFVEVFYLSECKAIYDTEVENLSRLCLAEKRQVEETIYNKVLFGKDWKLKMR